MPSLDRFHPHFLADPADIASSGSQHILFVLVAAAVLLFAFVSMARAVGPVVEIIKSALYAVSTFLLIALAVVLLLISLFR